MSKLQTDDNSWTTENGREKVWYAENPATQRIYFTSPMSDLQPGYVLKSTTNPKEMDRLFNLMHEQEREHNEKLIEQLYSRGREYYEKRRSALLSRLRTAGVTEVEKGIIRKALQLMDEKDAKMQQNTVYGVSAMQEAPAPLPPRRKRIM